MPNKKEHDTLATRLSQILRMFNDGRRFSVEELAEEFCVSERTIQRDLNRLSYLPIEKNDGYYSLATYCLGQLSFNDIKQFATFSGIRELYPALSDALIVDTLNERTNRTIEVYGHKYENLSDRVDDFNYIGSAIVTYKKIQFLYKDKVRVVDPYKLNNMNGIWYFVGVEDGTLKNFSFSSISNLVVIEEKFTEDEEIVKNIEEHRGTWFTQNHIEVILEVDASVSNYFLRRDLLPNQTTLEETEEGLILSTQVAYDEEILKVVRYWIPHIKITSPLYLQEKLEKSLKNYLNL
jgi:predicted DNA-binding transcriptional regulator YafY